MSIVEIILIGIGLSMDAFAVSITNGMTKKNLGIGWGFASAFCFGAFQGLMPAIGYALGSSFTKYIQAFDHYIALFLLGFIGAKMLADGIVNKDEEDGGCRLTPVGLLMQGIATSIDALAVGVSFAAVMSGAGEMLTAVLVIAVVTFSFSAVGAAIGKKSGDFLGSKAQIVGGLILIGIGVKIFVEHVFF